MKAKERPSLRRDSMLEDDTGVFWEESASEEVSGGMEPHDEDVYLASK